MNKIKILTIIIMMSLSAIGFAQNKVGTAAADFLTIPIGARATGMGGAFVASANDASASFWNVGGLARLTKSEFQANYAEWLVPGTGVSWAGVALKLDENNALALSFTSLNYGEEEITTAQNPNGTGARWDAMDLAFGLSYSRNLTDRFSVGGTVKYIQSRIWHESASAFAMDIGLLFTTQFNGLRIGMNITNFGSEMKLAGKDLLQPVDIDPAHSGNNSNIVSNLDTDSWGLPLNFTVGVAGEALDNENWKWTIATDAIYPNNTTPYLNLGTELTWLNMVSFRVGYNSLFKEAAEEGIAAGLGLQYDFSGVDLKIDYSYSDFGIFGGISRYAITIGF